MISFLLDAITWIKAVHVIAVIAWMAGLLYLPRLFVYHAQTQNPDMRATFHVMERRLLKLIANPAMIVTWIAGLLMVVSNPDYYFASGWFHAKLALVILLTLFHALLARWYRRFDVETRTARFYRIANEIPTIIVILVVVMVIVRPF